MAELIILSLIISGISSICSRIKKKREEIKYLRWQVKALQDRTAKEIQNFEKKKEETLTAMRSSATALPYFSKIIADFDTRSLDLLAQQLNWGSDKKRLKKVQSLLELKRQTAAQIAEYKEAEYQLAHLLKVFPELEEFVSLEASPKPLQYPSESTDNFYDYSKNYLTSAEYAKLNSVQRNQLALDRYRESHTKTNWQIGRDYELYVGYRYTLKGYQVEYFGETKGLEDLGRDVIAKKDGKILIIQCKYWSAKKQIREKHINQLYGTIAAYCFENNLSFEDVYGVFITNITLSPVAKRFAEYLSIQVVENFSIGPYPCIKCNINRATGDKIYHLPFDQQYDSCHIKDPGEFFALTVQEAESKGFRRAWRHYGSF